MLSGFAYVYFSYVLFIYLFFFKKQKPTEWKKPVSQNYVILFFFCFCLKKGRSDPHFNKLTLFCLKYFHKNLFAITIISQSYTRVFFTWNITSSPYLEMLLINLIKLLFLLFFLDRNVPCYFLQFIEALTAGDFHTQIF